LLPVAFEQSIYRRITNVDLVAGFAAAWKSPAAQTLSDCLVQVQMAVDFDC
jgi:hypothetical protein